MKTSLTFRWIVLSSFLVLFFCALPAQALHSAEISFHADTTNTSSMLYFFKLVLYKEKGLTEPDAITMVNPNDRTAKGNNETISYSYFRSHLPVLFSIPLPDDTLFAGSGNLSSDAIFPGYRS